MKKHKHDKYKTSKMYSLMDFLLGGSSGRKRRRSSSTSSREKSHSKHRYSEIERRGEKRSRSSKRRSSKHRRRDSRSTRVHNTIRTETSYHNEKKAQSPEPKKPDNSQQKSHQNEQSEVIVPAEILSSERQELDIKDSTDQGKLEIISKESEIKIKKPEEQSTPLAVKPSTESVQEIYTNLLQSWRDIVQQGLSGEETARLIDKYRLLDDSQQFRAPILNPALKLLLNGAEIVRDDQQISEQNRFGSMISSIQKGIFLIINSDKKSSSLARTVESMIDCASFIAQLHYSESIYRRSSVLDDLGIQKIEIGGRVGDNLFSRDEEKAILERREFEMINFEVEKRLADAEKKIKENEPPPEEANITETQKAQEDEEEEEEVVETPCSQRFQIIDGTQRFLSKPKAEGAKGVKSEKLLKGERGEKRSYEPRPYPGIDELMRMAKLRQGVPEIAIPLMKSQLAPATWKSYDKQLAIWWIFCERESVDFCDPTVADVLSFMTENHNNGVKTSVLKTSRAALSQIVVKDLGKNDFLSMLFKGLETAESSKKNTQ